MKTIQITEEVKEKAIEKAIEISYSIYVKQIRRNESFLDNLIKSFKIIGKAKEFKELESLLETVEIMSDAEAFKSIELTSKEYKKRNLIPIEEIMKEFEL